MLPQVRAIHVIHDLTQAFWHGVVTIFVAAPLASLGVGAVVEVGGMLANHRFAFTPATHALALAFALVTGYAVALTLAVVEIARGARAVTSTLEREVSDRDAQFKRLGAGITQFERRLGHR